MTYLDQAAAAAPPEMMNFVWGEEEEEEKVLVVKMTKTSWWLDVLIVSLSLRFKLFIPSQILEELQPQFCLKIFIRVNCCSSDLWLELPIEVENEN